MFRSLKDRGLHDVDFVVSDDHRGLREPIAKSFTGASWQRCQVHVMRNLLGHSPSKERKAVAQKRNADTTSSQRRLRRPRSRPSPAFEGAFEDTLVVLSLPEKYRRRLRSTNMQERLNEEIRRRERVIRIFPNDQSAIRMVGALLAESNDDWEERAYFDMAEYHEWKAISIAAPMIAQKGRTAA